MIIPVGSGCEERDSVIQRFGESQVTVGYDNEFANRWDVDARKIGTQSSPSALKKATGPGWKDEHGPPSQ